mmetsp:Transcript_127794/g.238902  ORF Transcript_127794/g.238902 Transcript_127794/m.238902 type:complete len:241 (+) Transcript_127794:133-855(+)
MEDREAQALMSKNGTVRRTRRSRAADPCLAVKRSSPAEPPMPHRLLRPSTDETAGNKATWDAAVSQPASGTQDILMQVCSTRPKDFVENPGQIQSYGPQQDWSDMATDESYWHGRAYGAYPETGLSTGFEPDADDGSTGTMMLCNIPCSIQKDKLIQVLHETGFDEKYSYIYLPTRKHNKYNLGYAFISFISSGEAKRFARTFRGFRFKGTLSCKMCDVRPAHYQGMDPRLQANNILFSL